MPRKAQLIVSADLSLSSGLFDWLRDFSNKSGLNDSDVVRAALDYYRASTGPEVVLLQRKVKQLAREVSDLQPN